MLDKLSASAKLYMLIFITAASLIGLGIYGIDDVQKMDANTHSLYVDRVLPIQQLSNARFEYSAEILPLAQKVKNHLLTFAEAKKRLQKSQAIIDINWYNYKLTYLTAEEVVLVKQADVAKKQTDEACAALMSILGKQDAAALDAFIQNKFSANPDPFFVKLTQLMELQVRVGREILNSNNEIYHTTEKKFFLLILLSLGIALSLSFYIIKNIKGLIKNILSNNNIAKESEERYRSLFEQASDAIYVVNFKGEFTQVNDSMCKMVGYTREELLTMTVTDILNADLLKSNPLMYNKVEPGAVVTGERKFVHRSGAIVDIEINGKKFSDDRVLVIFRDITGRKKMEAELRKAELKFRTLADKSMVGIYIVQKGKFIYVNPRFAEVFGYEPHELTGKSPVEAIVHPDYQAISNENIRARVDGELEGVHYEAMGKRKDGSSNWVEFYGSRTIMEEEPTIIGSMIDITERKMAEEELRTSEQKYKLLFDSSPMPLLMVAKNDLSIIAANQEATKLYGYTNRELLTMTIKDMRHEEDRDKIWDYYNLTLGNQVIGGYLNMLKKTER